jgi:transposase
MKKILKQAYTAEFKEPAVKRVNDGQTIAAAAKELCPSGQTLRNWIKAAAAGKLTGAGGTVVTPEAMELSRRRSKVARLKRENGIIRKAATVPFQLVEDVPANVPRALVPEFIADLI